MGNDKILFLCKDRGYGSSFGLFLSSRFVAEALESKGVWAKVVIVVDANGIDREVHRYRPTHVILEALWVTPEKLRELAKLHPNVKWVVRIHSEIPFISYESMAFEWMFKYQEINKVWVASNSSTMNSDLGKVNIHSLYLPNIYFPAFFKKDKVEWSCEEKSINVGCFGAIRPLKNQLEQGVAAISFANNREKALRFHINASRTEQNGNSTLKNLRAMFRNSPPHRLIEHDWMKHEDFIGWVRKMDLGMQVSFSETFNIVTADFVDNNIPIVVSNEVSWMPRWAKTSTTDTNDIVRAMNRCYDGRKISLQFLNRICLCHYNHKSLKEWMSYL